MAKVGFSYTKHKETEVTPPTFNLYYILVQDKCYKVFTKTL